MFEYGEYIRRKCFPSTSQQCLTTNTAEHMETHSELQQSTAACRNYQTMKVILCVHTTLSFIWEPLLQFQMQLTFLQFDYKQSGHILHSSSEEREHNNSLQEQFPKPQNWRYRTPHNSYSKFQKIFTTCCVSTTNSQQLNFRRATRWCYDQLWTRWANIASRWWNTLCS